jgi:peptide/nickel transport system substrate-binding protein
VDNPFADLKVRQALYQTTNVDQLQQKVMRGKSRSAGAVVAPPIPGSVPELDERLPFDPDAARALLAEASVPEGLEFDFDCHRMAWSMKNSSVRPLPPCGAASASSQNST